MKSEGIKFEDTKLPRRETTRIAFKKAQFQVAVENMGKSAPQKDTGIGPASLTLFVRAGETLYEALPTPAPEQMDAVAEQVAAAVLFLNFGFQEPSLMKRAHSSDLPRVCTWAQEWRDVRTANIALEEISVELRQIVTAAHIAVIEGLKDNLETLNVNEVRKNLEEKDLIAKELGNIHAPALEAKFKQVRSEIEDALAQREKSGTTFLRRLGL